MSVTYGIDATALRLIADWVEGPNVADAATLGWRLQPLRGWLHCLLGTQRSLRNVGLEVANRFAVVKAETAMS
jgi:hypothetical protein